MAGINFDREAIGKLCQKHNLRLLILHGSYAKGMATDKSDLDIGILGREKIGHKSYSEILKDFGELFGEKFDPAFLNGAEPMICLHVAMSGQPLFEAAKGDFANFRVQSIARYMDTKKFRELEKIYIKRAVGRA